MAASVQCPKGYGKVTFDNMVCPITMKGVGCLKCEAPEKKMPKPVAIGISGKRK